MKLLRVPFAALVALWLVACRPDGSVEDPVSKRREGMVSVGAAELQEFPLDWQAPQAIGAKSAEAQLKLAEAALGRGDVLEGSDSAAAHLNAALLDNAEGARFDALQQAVVLAVIQQGDMHLQSLATHPPDANRLAHLAAAILRTVAPDAPETLLYLTRVDASDRLQALLLLGEEDLAAGNLGEGTKGAVVDFREVLRNRPDDVRAIAGLQNVQKAFVIRAWRASNARDYGNVVRWMHLATDVIYRPHYIALQWNALERQRMLQVEALYNDARVELQDPNARGAIAGAHANLEEMRRIAVKSDGSVVDLAARIESARAYGAFEPGHQFTEALHGGGKGPDMVVVPIGTLMMGADANDREARPAEQPVHPVQFSRGFALSTREVTVAAFGQFVRTTGYETRAERRGHSMIYNERTGNFTRSSGVTWQDDYAGKRAAPDAPVVHVDVRDAEAFAAWLSSETNRNYRLPHESEFEYALRARSAGRYPWGDANPKTVLGNLTGDGDRSPSGRTWANAFPSYRDGYWGPAPVGHFPPNAFGLHDMVGNVSEWTADCWHQGYRRAPADGSAWSNPGCRSRVVRGGAWASSPAQHRAAWRMAQAHDVTNARTGFRVARDI